MNPSDLLYTNSFVNTNPLTQQEVKKNANEYIPYRNLKGETVNNVRDELERTGFTDASMNRVSKEANPWSRGYYGNQQPMLSEFGKDIAESSYFKYRSHYINIDSRMRDVALYPSPNNYSIFLGRKFNNVETVKLIDYFFPEMEYPINSTNNVILWYTIPFEIVNFISNLLPYLPFIGSDYTQEARINICGWSINFSRLIKTTSFISNFRELYNTNLLSCLNKVEITPGFYTTEQLEQKIRDEFQKTTFFNSNIYNNSYTEYSGNTGSETFKFKDRPQCVDVKIDPETSNVQFLLRYEEFRVKSIATYYNKNYFDIEMKSIDSSIASPEFLELINNNLYPIVITGFPDIGGFTGDNVNYIEFIPENLNLIFKNLLYRNSLFNKTYYTKITNTDGTVIPNVLRFYLYTLPSNVYSSPSISIKSSYTEIINENNIKFGREAPFFFINGDQSLLSNYVKYVKNNIINISNLYDDYCADTSVDCSLISQEQQIILDELLVNIDCSSRILTNILGFPNTNNSRALIGTDVFGSFAIITNNVFKANKYINSIQTYNININKFIEYSECTGLLPPTPLNLCNTQYTFWIDYYPEFNLNYRLPISRNQNGTYSFYLNNYFFMKILSSSVGTQIQTSSTITQIKPTANFANGSSDSYEINDGTNNGIQYYVNNPSYVDPKCPVIFKNAKFSRATKNLNNLFAKIKYSSVSGNYEVDNRFVNEIIFESNTINNLDEFVIQLVDYEGKILPQVKEHNFTLLIVEKYEVLKETNINSRNNNVNIGGIKPVERNSFSNS